MARFSVFHYFICLLCFSIVIIYIYSARSDCDKNRLDNNPNRDNVVPNVTLSSKSLEDARGKQTIRIASVVCPKPEDTELREEVAVMMKSVVMSTLLYEIADRIEFHLILLNVVEDETYFRVKLKEYTHPMSEAQFSLHAYSAADAVSKYYPASMNSEERLPCLYLRIFIPSILEHADSVIYFDTDIIVTGNVQQLFTMFYNMTSEQMVALAPDYTASTPTNPFFFKNLPFVPPKGLNSGVQLMNLTRMRNYGWQEKLLRLYDDYAIRQNVTLKSDQKLTNILLYFASDIFLQLPCQYNYWRKHCSEGVYCESSLTDPDGIHVIHGADDSFSLGRPFFEIFWFYSHFKFSSTTTKSHILDLMRLIRDQYVLPSNGEDISAQRRLSHKSCDGSIDKVLFKKHLPPK